MRHSVLLLSAFTFVLFACDGDTISNETGIECETSVDCPEDCTDGRDNDGDSLTDCADEDCDGSCPEDCTDGRDNDGDSLTDCADEDCDGSCPEDCTDGRDNDGDSLTDCADEDCDGSCPEDCTDGRDNDGDSLIDCEDIDCETICAEDCTDGIDNDGDGAIDCDDDECDGDCLENCTDGRDNDGDSLIDCEDADCDTDPSCFEDCTDGIDNDGDGLTDCYDDECWSKDCHPKGMQAFVQSGGPVTEKRMRLTSYQTGSACTSTFYTRIKWGEGEAKNISGKVRTKPGGAASWTTCDWTVDTAKFEWQAENYIFYGSPVERHGVNVTPGCGIPASNSDFLPTSLIGYHDFGISITDRTGPLWYLGTGTRGEWLTSFVFTSSSSCYYGKSSIGFPIIWSPLKTGTTHDSNL